MTARVPMPIRQRAKQFAMFDAMKGLTEAIAETERQICPKRELACDKIQQIDRQLSRLRVGDRITLHYYCRYAKTDARICGRVTKIDAFWQTLQIDGKTVDFAEITDLLWEADPLC